MLHVPSYKISLGMVMDGEIIIQILFACKQARAVQAL